MLNIALSSSREPIYSLSLLGPLVVIPAVCIALLTVSVVVNPPRATENAVLKDEYGFTTVMYHYCQFNDKERNDVDNTPVLQIFVALHYTILMVLFRMAWHAKNVDIAFNEARGIYYSLCVDAISFCFAVVLGLLIHYKSDLLGIAVVDLIFVCYIEVAFAVALGNIIFIVLPKFSFSRRATVPEVVNADSRLFSNISVLTMNSVLYSDQAQSTASVTQGDPIPVVFAGEQTIENSGVVQGTERNVRNPVSYDDQMQSAASMAEGDHIPVEFAGEQTIENSTPLAEYGIPIYTSAAQG